MPTRQKLTDGLDVLDDNRPWPALATHFHNRIFFWLFFCSWHVDDEGSFFCAFVSISIYTYIFRVGKMAGHETQHLNPKQNTVRPSV